jgi:hypothetical protein
MKQALATQQPPVHAVYETDCMLRGYRYGETITYMIVDLKESLLKAKTEDSQGFREFLKTSAAGRLFGEDITTSGPCSEWHWRRQAPPGSQSS